MRVSYLLIAVLSVPPLLTPAHAGSYAKPPLHLASQTAALSAQDAGRRGGEAAGAAALCYQLKVTDKVAELRARFQGDDLARFDAEAGRILQAWLQVKDCVNGEDPNQCKIAQRSSCMLALREIGPAGSVVQGLIELK